MRYENPIAAAGRLELAGKALCFTNHLRCLALSKGDRVEAAGLYRSLYPNAVALDAVMKSAVPAATTADATWGSPLSPMDTYAEAFIKYLRPRTIFGKMTGFRFMPMNTKAPRGVAGASAAWVGAGRPVPLSKGAFDAVTMKPAKISALIVANDELLRSSNPVAAELFREDTADAVSDFQTRAFLDPSAAEIDDVSPASITNGETEIASSGTTAPAFAEDFKDLCAAIQTNFLSPYLIMTPRTAVGLASLDCQLTRDVTVNGGFVGGIPVAVTGNAPSDGNSPGDGTITLVDTSEVLLSEGPIEFSASTNAIIEMTSTPDSPATAATVFTSMWQNHQTAVMATRYIRWEKRRAGCAAILTGVNF
ncbi:phage major capsid protein [Bradyrhizobium sp. AUGA SZCCT0283]|uniref:phage major capsid protein n=1 Tax=Bradyrhizobium sp. AUGA SZCCT0283 TaxID=2807671 RepID=UPI001BA76500|nr:phage major capsid protein [Bradyrhizobium sp. AUGA SZCCT0283]MBR1277466.1 phage major capsid protein [Bradyrhizobium sp. AUGA SZCCT0283]